MRRRKLLTSAGLALLGHRLAHAEAVTPLALGAAWRGPREDDAQHLGVLTIDWAQRRVGVRWSLALPSRAHGLVAEADGALLAVAARPGTWLLRCDAEGRVMRHLSITDEAGGHRFDGHAVASADGRWWYTTQSAPDGHGFVAVRERDSLRKVDEWPTHGVDPHQLLLDANGDLMLANGGILRTSAGKKRDLDRMASSLVRLNGRNGMLDGHWTLPDARLSLRHLAWSSNGRRLGVALQAEHDDPAARSAAPLLAVWDGQALTLPAAAADGGGYAGDIAPAVAGGFALSAQRAHRVLAWWAERHEPWARLAEVQEPCALASADDALLLASGAGVARWHPSQAPAMLRWPAPMALDNHWVVMVA